MLAKLSVIALLGATAFVSALPAESQNSVSKRQDEYNFWKLHLYTSGCDDEETEYFSGYNDQTFDCTGSGKGWHNVKMENMAATGHKVLLYSDAWCGTQIGTVSKDESCYSAPSDTVISAYAIVMA